MLDNMNEHEKTDIDLSEERLDKQIMDCLVTKTYQVGLNRTNNAGFRALVEKPRKNKSSRFLR